MTEAEWLACGDWRRVLDATSGLKLSPRKCGLFTVACCAMVFDWLIDARSREAVQVIEDYADGVRGESDILRASIRADKAANVVGGAPAFAVSWAADHKPNHPTCASVAHEVERSFKDANEEELTEARTLLCEITRCVFGNPFRPVVFRPAWRSEAAVLLARSMYDARDFGPMPVLADALEEAGCDRDAVLSHCRTDGTHARGCWVTDAVLGKS